MFELIQYRSAHEPTAELAAQLLASYRTRAGASELGSSPMRRRPAASRPATGEDGALAAIDAALVTAAHRTAFSRAEVGTMFHDVGVAVRDPATGATVRSVFDDALPADDAQLIARSRVVDVLLDARLLVASPG